MFEKMGAAWVRRLKACVVPKGGFCRVAQNSDPEASHRTAQRHSTKHTSFNIHLNSIAPSTDTDNTCLPKMGTS